MEGVAASLLLLAARLLVQLLGQALGGESGRSPAGADPGGLAGCRSAYGLGLPKRGALPPCARGPAP